MIKSIIAGCALLGILVFARLSESATPSAEAAASSDDDTCPIQMGKDLGESCKSNSQCDRFFKCIHGYCGGCDKATDCPTNYTCNKKDQICVKMK